MTTTAEKIAVMQAFEDGAEIETRFSCQWVMAENPIWNWNSYDYRVAEKPPRDMWLNFHNSNKNAFAYNHPDKCVPDKGAEWLETYSVHYRRVSE